MSGGQFQSIDIQTLPLGWSLYLLVAFICIFYNGIRFHYTFLHYILKAFIFLKGPLKISFFTYVIVRKLEPRLVNKLTRMPNLTYIFFKPYSVRGKQRQGSMRFCPDTSLASSPFIYSCHTFSSFSWIFKLGLSL